MRPIWFRPFRDYPRNFRRGTPRSTLNHCDFWRGNSRMGERVTQSGRARSCSRRAAEKGAGSGSPARFCASLRTRPSEGEWLLLRHFLSGSSILRARPPSASPQNLALNFSSKCSRLRRTDSASPIAIIACSGPTKHSCACSATQLQKSSDSRWRTLVVPSGPAGGVAVGTESRSPKGERITLETKRRKKDGTLLDVSVSCAPLLAGREDGRLLRRISRHFRSQARRGAEFRALPRRRKEQQRARSAAVLCRCARHCRRVDVRAEFLYRALRSGHRAAQLSLISSTSRTPRLRPRNWAAA